MSDQASCAACWSKPRCYHVLRKPSLAFKMANRSAPDRRGKITPKRSRPGMSIRASSWPARGVETDRAVFAKEARVREMTKLPRAG